MTNKILFPVMILLLGTMACATNTVQDNEAQIQTQGLCNIVLSSTTVDSLKSTKSTFPLQVSLGSLSAYESLFYNSGGGEYLEAEEIERHCKRLASLVVPSEIEERLRQVQRLWGIVIK